jgi:cullin-5
LFQDKGQLLFEDKWPAMRPIILKLLQQEPVTQTEWQELFYSVHLVCLWDEKGPPKVKDSLKDDIMDFIKKAQQVIIITMTP